MDLAAQAAGELAGEQTMVRDFLPPDAQPEIYQEASPLAHLHDHLPPVWIAHGSVDAVVSISQSCAMVDGLRKHGHPVLFLEAAEIGHTLIDFDHARQPVEPLELLFERDVLRFIARCLLGNPPPRFD